MSGGRSTSTSRSAGGETDCGGGGVMVGGVGSVRGVGGGGRACLRQVRSDVGDLARALGLAPPEGWVEREGVEWLSGVPRARLNGVLTFEFAKGREGIRGGLDARDDAQRVIPCPDCNKMFHTRRAMVPRRVLQHKWAHPIRSLVQSDTCPACTRELGSVASARRHLQDRTCLESRTAQFRSWVEQQHEIQGLVGGDNEESVG